MPHRHVFLVSFFVRGWSWLIWGLGGFLVYKKLKNQQAPARWRFFRSCEGHGFGCGVWWGGCGCVLVSRGCCSFFFCKNTSYKRCVQDVCWMFSWTLAVLLWMSVSLFGLLAKGFVGTIQVFMRKLESNFEAQMFDEQNTKMQTLSPLSATESISAMDGSKTPQLRSWTFCCS